MSRSVGAVAVVCLLAATMGGCKNHELPDLRGRYVGTQSVANEQIQVVAELPNFVSEEKIQVLRFDVFPTLASAHGSRYSVTILDEKWLSLAAPMFGLESLPLVRSGNCGRGTFATQTVRLCWATNKLSLEIGSLSVLSLDRSNALPSPEPDAASGRVYSLDELIGRARFQSYSVAQEAERVYQSRQAIGEARGRLLPHLNLRAVVGVFTGDYLDVVGAVLPFLFPSNWFNWKASKELFQAEKMAFASVRGNQMSAVEGLYYLIYRDQTVLAQLEQQLDWMRKMQASLRAEEEAGTLPNGSADYFGASIATLDKDRNSLSAMVMDEYADLAHGVALPPMNSITSLGSFEVPALDTISPIRPEEFVRDAQARSFELRSLGFMLKANRFMTKEVLFSFLSPEGSGALGFETASTFKIGKSREREVTSKKEETSSIIEQRAVQVANEYNGALAAHSIAKGGLAASKRRLRWLMERHLNGDKTLDPADFVEQAVELNLKSVAFSADLVSSVQAWLMSRAKLQRLLLQGFYQKLDEGLPQP